LRACTDSATRPVPRREEQPLSQRSWAKTYRDTPGWRPEDVLPATLQHRKNVGHRRENFRVSQERPPRAWNDDGKTSSIVSNVLPTGLADDAHPGERPAAARPASGLLPAPDAGHASSFAALAKAHVFIATSNRSAFVCTGRQPADGGPRDRRSREGCRGAPPDLSSGVAAGRREPRPSRRAWSILVLVAMIIVGLSLG